MEPFNPKTTVQGSVLYLLGKYIALAMAEGNEVLSKIPEDEECLQLACIAGHYGNAELVDRMCGQMRESLMVSNLFEFCNVHAWHKAVIEIVYHAYLGSFVPIHYLPVKVSEFVDEVLDDALVDAAGSGNLIALQQYCEWGATALNQALQKAAMCEDAALGKAAVQHLIRWRNEHIEKFHMEAWDVDSALKEAAGRGNVATMRLLHSAGASNINVALVAAAKYNQLDAMGLLHQWGATSNDEALLEAVSWRCHEAAAKLREWGASNDRPSLDDV